MKAKNKDTCIKCGLCCGCTIMLGQEDPRNPELWFIKKHPELVVKDSSNYILGPRPKPNEPVRCYYLEGELGIDAHCTIYKTRPNICLDFPRNHADLRACNTLRRKYGLAEVTDSDFEEWEDKCT